MVLTHTMYQYEVETFRLHLGNMNVAVHSVNFGHVIRMFPDAVPHTDDTARTDRMVCVDKRGNVTTDIVF